jgi:hypothetical protein
LRGTAHRLELGVLDWNTKKLVDISGEYSIWLLIMMLHIDVRVYKPVRSSKNG